MDLSAVSLDTAPGAPGAWCGHCGGPASEGEHDSCVRMRELEPQRYCTQCRRRMKVQVVPQGWTATCVAHGSVEHSTWS